ncbi:MAG: helicase [Candidatus Tyloplasma litorale]|nr:MAG: helicase [Mycoplasmatales bacterium]
MHINYINPSLNKYLNYKKFEKLLPIQNIAIPKLIKKKNLFIEAPTGTGKTLTFLLPILQNINFDNFNTQAIIIAPTRELSTQIHNVLKEIKPFLDYEIKSLLAIGGEDFNDQERKLKNGSQIIIGTIDRINSLREKINHSLIDLKYFIIDEVDMIFNFDAFKNIEVISKKIPYWTTISFFSASFPLELQNLIKKTFNKEIDNIIIKKDAQDKIDSFFIKAYDGDKLKTLIELLNSNQFNPFFSLIFTKTNEEAEFIYSKLKTKGFKNVALFSSNLSQRERNRLLKKINKSEIIYLITTDLMSRGMDFPGVTHIVNYSLPIDLTYYKHRIGRTDRNIVKGNIYDIYNDSDIYRYNEIVKKNPNVNFTKIKLK